MTLTLMMVSADPAANSAKPTLVENHTLISFVEEAPEDPAGPSAVGTGLRGGKQNSAASRAWSSRRAGATGNNPAAKTPARYSKASYAGLNQDGAPPAKLPDALLDYSGTSYQDAPVLPQVPADQAQMDAQTGGQMDAQTDGQMYCDDGCWMCDPCCKGWGWGHKLHAWKTVWKPNMLPHIPYRAQPADYYYFRPYNALHIPPQQQEVMIYGEDPRDPYANKVFEGIYEGLEDETEAVDVPQPQRPVPPEEAQGGPALPAAAPAFPPPVPTDTPSSSGSAWVPLPSAAPLSVDNVWVPKAPNTPQRSSAGKWASRSSATPPSSESVMIPQSSATPPLRSTLVPKAANASRPTSSVHVSGASFRMSDNGTYETSGNPLR